MRKLFIVIIFACLTTFLSGTAEAQMDHMESMDALTTTDGDFEGVLQATPATPTAQQQVTLMFTITDRSHQFQITTCDCEVTIAVPDRLPYTQKITTPSATTNGLYSVMVPFVFPRGGTYDITFTGKPNTPNAFEEFTLLWHFTANPASNEIQTLKTPKKNAQSLILPFAVTGAFLLTASFIIRKKNR